MNEQLKTKIREAAEKVDKIVDFAKIASKVKNKPVRILVAGFELVDGTVFRVALTEVIELIPEKAHPVVEAWLDAFIAGDYLLLVESTGGFLAQLNLIPLVEENDEKNVYVALLTAIVRLIPQTSVARAA
jgi:hypothetical protein